MRKLLLLIALCISPAVASASPIILLDQRTLLESIRISPYPSEPPPYPAVSASFSYPGGSSGDWNVSNVLSLENAETGGIASASQTSHVDATSISGRLSATAQGITTCACITDQADILSATSMGVNFRLLEPTLWTISGTIGAGPFLSFDGSARISLSGVFDMNTIFAASMTPTPFSMTALLAPGDYQFFASTFATAIGGSDQGGTRSFGSGTVNFASTLTPVPEPASVLLVASGLVATWRYRTKRTRTVCSRSPAAAAGRLIGSSRRANEDHR